MEYIMIPKEVYDLAPKAKLQALGMDNPRMNNKGTEVLLHVENYNKIEEFSSPIMSLGGENGVHQYPYPVYVNPSDDFSELLESEDWSYGNIQIY